MPENFLRNRGAAAGPPRLVPMRERYESIDRAAVAEVVRSVLSTMSGDLTAAETSLLAEVEELGRTIANAKAEIAALRVRCGPEPGHNRQRNGGGGRFDDL